MRGLRVVDSADVTEVFDALRDALAGDGPAILPRPSSVSSADDISTSLDDRTTSLDGRTIEQRVAVVVETSGSTARPKRVMLSADALLASAAASETALGASGQWLLALPTHYIAGLAVLVRSLAAGTDPVVLDPRGFTPEAFVAAAARLDHPTRFVSLVPAQFARLMASDAAVDALRGFEGILVGGQSTPVALAAAAVDKGLRLTRTYGASETCGGCVYNGVPIGNTEIAIVDGRIELSGSVIAEGYLDDPRRTAFSFPEHDGRRWYRTDDTGAMHHGRLAVTGRIDDVIISGGIKVSLAEVESVVRDQLGLADSVVVAAPHPQWGEVPVVVGTATMGLKELRREVALRLGPAASPDRMLLVDELPLLPSGKPDRLAIAALALK